MFENIAIILSVLLSITNLVITFFIGKTNKLQNLFSFLISAGLITFFLFFSKKSPSTETSIIPVMALTISLLISFSFFQQIKFRKKNSQSEEEQAEEVGISADALVESEKRLIKAQEIAQVGNWELEIGSKTIWGSQQAFNIYGLSHESSVIPLSEIQSVVCEDDRNSLNIALHELIHSEKRYDVEFRITTPSGEKRYIHSVAELVKNDENKPIKVVGVLQDMTDRKKSENQLLLNKVRLEAMVELMGMSNRSIKEIVDFSLEKSIEITESKMGYLAFLSEDESVLNMHSWTKSALAECEIIDKPLSYLVSETGLWGEAIRQRKPVMTNDYNAPCPNKKGYPDGHVKIDRHMNIPIFDDDKIVVLIGVGNKDDDYNDTDILQLKLFMNEMWALVRRIKAEEALKESEIKFSSIFSQLPVGIYRSTQDGKILFANQALADIFGYDSVDEILNVFTHDTYVSIDQREQIIKKWNEDNNSKSYHVFDLNLITKDNRKIWVRNTERAIYGENGEIQYLDGTIEDITIKKVSDERIRSLNEELEQKVIERTIKLNEALRQLEDTNEEFRSLNQDIAEESQKLLNLNDKLAIKEQELTTLNKELEDRVTERTSELNEVLERLEDVSKLNSIVLSNLGHELRTPLNGILGFTNILIGEITDDDHLECLAAIKTSGDRLRNTLNSLLVLTELEAGKTQLDFEFFNLVDYANHYFYTMKDSISLENLNFELIKKNEEIDVYLSEYLLTQILFNLIDNAIKFTQEGSITIELDKINKNGTDFAVMSIIDTGSGISEEKQSKIFEPFRQVSEGIDRTHEGVGLGLTITKKMVELMNGSIEVESKENEGTRFSLYFDISQRPKSVEFSIDE